MKAVILAAGKGERMRPLTDKTPKPMIMLLGKPLLCHILKALPDEINEVVLVIGYLGEQIKKYFGDRFGRFNIKYIEQKEKLGTGHALHLCRDFVGSERFLMLFADDLHSKENLGKLLKRPLSILVKQVQDPRRFGVVLIDKNNKVLEIEEKPENPRSNTASTGAAVLDARIFKYPLIQHPNGEFYITNSLTKLAIEHNIYAVEADFWIPIGYPEDLKKAEKILSFL
ncbi:MAG: sugar phosphate nucleotidyltransferase [Patescibacteria group bacterium]